MRLRTPTVDSILLQRDLQMNMNNARSERLATLLARGLSRIRKREGENWAVAARDRDVPADAPETRETDTSVSCQQEDRDES